MSAKPPRAAYKSDYGILGQNYMNLKYFKQIGEGHNHTYTHIRKQLQDIPVQLCEFIRGNIYSQQKVRQRKIDFCVPQKTDHAPELS